MIVFSAIEQIKEAVWSGKIGYTNKHGTNGVIAQDEAIDFLIKEEYSEDYARKVLPSACSHGDAQHIAPELYLVKLV